MAKPTELTIDLIDLLNRVESNEDKLNKYSEILRTESAKRSFGQKVISKIKDNTASGKDKDGNDLKSPYSDSYAKSFRFKLYGKSQGDVNMKLTGRMLASMDIVDTGNTTITIGFNSSTQEQKAEGHILGTGNNNSLPVRDFFGLQDSEYKNLMLETIKDEASVFTDFVVDAVTSGIINQTSTTLTESQIAELTALGNIVNG